MNGNAFIFFYRPVRGLKSKRVFPTKFGLIDEDGKRKNETALSSLIVSCAR